MKKKRLHLFLLIFIFITLTSSQIFAAGEEARRRSAANAAETIMYTPWDVDKASLRAKNLPQYTRTQNNQIQQYLDQKAYTIMIYMNGSDLESDNGAATDDIIEMLDSGVNTDNINIILFTGGTNRWRNNVIPSNNCVLWKIDKGELKEITAVGLVNMGDSGTLSSFIEFSMRNFPAEKYGLIMWDHGGGSIAGYGHDEKFYENNLTLLEMEYAFEKAGLAENKLEFLGFDSCLMATVEMAVVASDYARYMVASEDLEPGDGWDYWFLSELNPNPDMEGGEVGKAIADYYMDYYGSETDEPLTMSVTDLSEAGNTMDALGALMRRCYSELQNDRASSFATFAKKRYGTKTFGNGSPRDNDCDMVDAGDMAIKLSDLFPEETGKVLATLGKSVIYNRHNSLTDLKGLSSYYIYGGRDTADVSLATYSALDLDGRYTGYMYEFADMLVSGVQKNRSRNASLSGNNDIVPSYDELAEVDLAAWKPSGSNDGYYIMTGIQNNKDINPYEAWEVNTKELWPAIYGRNICLFKINRPEDSAAQELYAIPAELNGRDCDIIVSINEKYPNGKILGSRQEDGFIIQKGFDELKTGDTLAFYYPVRCFDGLNEISGVERSNELKWHKGEEFLIDEEPKIEWASQAEGVLYSLRLIDIWKNEYYTRLI